MENNDVVKFDALKNQIETFVKPALVIKVTDVETGDAALTSARQVKVLEKAIEEKRKQLVAPYNEHVKAINAYAKKLLEPLHGAEKHLKTELIEWELNLEKVRRKEKAEAEERQRREREELEARTRAENERCDTDDFFGGDQDASLSALAGLDGDRLELAAAQKREIKAIEANKVRGSQKVWVFEVEDETLVPPHFKTIDAGMIRFAINQGGQREIPGLKIFETVRVSIR